MARHSRMSTDVKPARELDIENASKEELIEYLCQTIQTEVEKGEDADCDLIRECSDWLDEITADLMVFTPEELEAKLEALKTGKDVPVSNLHKPHQTTSTPKIKHKVFARVAILVSSLMLLSVLSLSIMAIHAEYDSVWVYISSNFKTILGMDSGSELRGDGITIIKNSETRQYRTIEELLAKENLEILYPSKIPNDGYIKEIRWITEDAERYVLYFFLSNTSYGIDISNYYITDLTLYESAECIEVNNIKYYISSIDDISYQAICHYNGFEYTIDSDNYEDLITIIFNMKG